MSYIQTIKQASLKPVYSPRTTYSRYCQQIDQLSTHLAINIDKYMLGSIKQQFEKNNNELTQIQFISIGKKHMINWQKDLPDRQNKIIKCLHSLFLEIDQKNLKKINWQQFNTLIIQKVLNLKSLRNNTQNLSVLFKPSSWQYNHNKFINPIQKMLWIPQLKKIAYFCQASNNIEFLSIQNNQNSNNKTLQLNKQQLIVQTTITRRKKQGGKQNIKKDVVVASYKNIFLDMIYLKDPKYSMLLTSSSDKTVKGWTTSSSILSLAKQPENQDQKMIHQFSVEIHCMTWDNINQVLYCSGKSPRIYQWMIKTDSQTQLWDQDGHKQMISTMIMIPKLQFLATGGNDGKLILWDTIAQKKKFKYEGHTRSIVHITFHQNLILLFTAGYDHNICVWNPYIPTLIHKITNNHNVIQLGIIPQTNLLIALDLSGTVKIRQVNKFSLVSQFSVNDQEDHSKIQAAVMISTEQPLRYFFGGLGISCFDFIKMQNNGGVQAIPICLKYIRSKFKLITPIKNYVLVWNLLTGRLASTFKNQSDSQITAYDINQQLKLSVVGDNQGRLILRKLDNGLLFKKLYQFKSTVILTLFRNGGMWCDKVIFAISQDGQIIVFGRQLTSTDFLKLRNINAKKTYNIGNISAIDYQEKRNTLILGTNTGDIFFLDVDKSKLVSVFQTQFGQIQSFKQIQQIPLLLAFTKRGGVFGVYLPPHLKKFKPSCSLTTEGYSKVSCAIISNKNPRCYIGYQNGDIECFNLHSQIIIPNRREQTLTKIKYIWKCNLGQSIRDLLLVQQEDTLIAISGEKGLSLISCQNGSPIAKLLDQLSEWQIQPVFYVSQENNEIYLLKNKKHFKFQQLQGNELQKSVRKYHDPYLYIDHAQRIKLKYQQRSNPKWNFQPQIRNHVELNIKLIIQLNKILNQLNNTQNKKNNNGLIDFHKIIQLQKKFQQQPKQDQQQFRNTQMDTSKMKSTNQRLKRGQSLQQIKHNKISIFPSGNKYQNALYRMGLALKNIQEKDQIGNNFISMAQRHQSSKKNIDKFPRIK